MQHVLDRPAWSALTSRQSALAIGNERAKRYHPSIVPFAASADDDPASVAALGECLLTINDMSIFLQAEEIMLPSSLEVSETFEGLQMIGSEPLPDLHNDRIRQLREDDADEMLALADLTQPGPFTKRALVLGDFFGVWMDGRLIAMAGERMKNLGFTEISGICVHPDFRGQGLARELSVHVARLIKQRGETPYLHAYSSNAAAIRLYENIGFRMRSKMHVAFVQRAG